MAKEIYPQVFEEGPIVPLAVRRNRTVQEMVSMAPRSANRHLLRRCPLAVLRERHDRMADALFRDIADSEQSEEVQH